MQGPVDYRVVDEILGACEEAAGGPLVCDSVTNYPARRPPHTPALGVTSTIKRAPPSIVDAERGGRYTTVLEVVRSTGISQASQLTGVPVSTIRDAVKRFEETGTVIPKKEEERKELALYSQQNR